MPQTRYREEYQNGVLVNRIPYQVSDAEILYGQTTAEYNAYHTLAVQAYRNWGVLTPTQKDRILQFLLGFYLVAGPKLGLFRIESRKGR